jgi:hypothetical protein
LESIYWNPTGDCDNFHTCGDILAWLEVHLGIVQSTPATPQRRDAVQLEMEQDIREEAEQDSGEEPEAVSLTKLHETPTMAVEETAEHISKASVFLFICCSQLFNLWHLQLQVSRRGLQKRVYVEPDMVPTLVYEISEPLLCHIEASEIASELTKIGKRAKDAVFKNKVLRRSFKVAVLDLNQDDPASKVCWFIIPSMYWTNLSELETRRLPELTFVKLEKVWWTPFWLGMA